MEQNTPTQIQELLKPRYLVIADYPGSYYDKGEIVEEDYFYAHEGGYHHSDYPHLFRKLEWWEHRKPEELPQYVKSLDKFGEVFRADGFTSLEQAAKYLNLFPATEQEYLTYQTSINGK